LKQERMSVLSGSGQPIKTLEQSSPITESRATAAHLALEVLHEIRSPLEALGNLTYLAYEEASFPEKVQEYMRLAQEQVATLNHIASQTLGFARYSPSPKPTNLAALMNSAVRIHQSTIDLRKVHLIKDLPDDLVAEVFSGEMLQVFSNLIANALDALPVKGILRLRCQKRNHEVHFVIADNGQGIASEHVDEVFAPFFTTKENTGTGIGLTLARKIVEHHRGRIRLRSSVRAGRCGTTFRISLPA
jgi:signal transduction histidine kinase